MTIYHLLPESEPFSEFYGGALSRWTANVLKSDASAVILAPSVDETWKFDSARVRTIARLRSYRRVLALCRDRVPPRVRRTIAARSLRDVFSRVTAGDVIYVHNRPEFAAAIHASCPRREFKLVLHMHNGHLRNHPEEFARCADLTVFCSAFLRRDAIGCVGDIPSTVVPNGADALTFFPSKIAWRPAPPTILFVGRLVPAKGAHVLIEAMRILERRRVNARARIVGNAGFGGARDTAYVRKLKADAPANVMFAPYKTGVELAADFRQATLFCCPSVFEEPFGMVNVEAMACALPIVAAEVGGVPEIFAEGGALLVPSNDPQKLAEALERMLQQPELRAQLAEEGQRSFHKNFTWDVVREKYHEALSAVTA